MKRHLVTAGVLFCALLGARHAVAEDQEKRCWAAGGTDTREIDGYTVEVRPTPGVKKGDFDDACQFIIRKGSRVFAKGTDVSIDIQATDVDLDGDGKRDVVIEAYSGGAHCCWTYWFYSLVDEPKLLARVENERGIAVQQIHGRAVIATQDGAFDYFDELCHACTVFPSVYLQFRNGRLVNVSPEFRADYDKEIDEFGSQICEGQLQAFKDGSLRTSDFNAYLRTKAAVFGIVLAYLYSGREALAWRNLSEQWPAGDYKRIRRLILQTRAEGVLRFSASSAPRR